MKTTILNQKKTMRKTNLVLTVVATLFSTFTFANNIERSEQDQLSDFATNQVIHTIDTNVVLKKQQVSLEDEIKFMDSIASYTSATQKEIVEKILENERIIESREDISPCVYLNWTTQEVIIQDNQVIEGNLDNTTYPLDFELIKNYQDANKNADIKNRAFDRKNLKS